MYWKVFGDYPAQPESAAIMNWMDTYLPDLGANMHGGSVVVNYAFDACDTLVGGWVGGCM